MIGLSPLPPAHPSTFQRKPVRPSSACHGAFSLAGGRSQSFASAAGDSKALFGPAFAPGARLQALTLAADERLVGSLCKRHAVTTRVAPTACGRTVSGTVSLPCSGCFSPFPHGTGSLSVSREYLALPDGPGGFAQNSSCSALLRIPLSLISLRLPDYHRLWLNFPEHSTHSLCTMAWSYNPEDALLHLRFGLFPVRSPLLGESFVYFLFL